MLPPKGFNHPKLQILNPNTHGSESTIIIIILTKLTCFLDFFVRSIPQETIFSNTASTVENAANDMNIKKKLPQSIPSGILLKMFGNVINISAGPDV